MGPLLLYPLQALRVQLQDGGEGDLHMLDVKYSTNCAVLEDRDMDTRPLHPTSSCLELQNDNAPKL